MKKLLLIALVAAMATACQKDSTEQTVGTGILHITPSVANDVNEVKNSTESNASGKTVAVPALSEFSLTIKGSDYDRTWASLTDYSADDERLTAGMYDVTIKYGNIEEEGYDKPYFYATKSVQVLDRNRTTEAELTATVGNAIVEIAMTPEFKGYFVKHEFKLKTAYTAEPFTLEENPAKDLFVAPQSVTLECACTRQNGKEEALTPQTFEVKARTRHIVKYDLEKAGNIKVNITLDETLIGSEVIDVELNENA